MNPNHSLTAKASIIANSIITPIKVQIPNTNQSLDLTGLWDTGATGSAITKRAADSLGLIPTGQKNVQTAGGNFVQNTYMVSSLLPNGVVIDGIEATEIDGIVGDDSDALIGMDVITLGDFSITNFKGCTCMSFRLPSSIEIDYTKYKVRNEPFSKTAGRHPAAPKKKKKK